ncbi:MAG: hypothetical protein IJ529_06120 [Alphaproteobacteria bacterium]|nr:hypothetical protein [Alphaproteobacteria bacterium]MBQ8678026.1 hypothetical protein [Alphaproteobacteria bacterium]
MSKEGILTKENTEQILRGVTDKSFFKGSLSKLSSGNTKQANENAPALVAMHDNYTIGFGLSKQVQEEKMARAAEIVAKAEEERIEKIATQKLLKQGGMGL